MDLIFALSFLLARAQDVTPRFPEPDAETQKAALRKIKDLFKDDYPKKSPADQADLGHKLLQAGGERGEDAATRFVCLAEARDLGAAAGDVDLALRAVTELGTSFNVQALPMKAAVLGKIAGAAKEPEKLRAAARGFHDLARESIAVEDFDSASSAAGKAETAARALKDVFLSGRIAEFRKDVASLKAEYQRVKSALDAPGSGDSDAAGRYLCFVRGDWGRGLKLLADAGKEPLKGLAAKELAAPAEAAGQAEIGDGWWDQAQTEKVLWKKTALLSRARLWYERALPSAGALLRAKVDKRLAEIESAVPGSVNLMRLIDPKKDAVKGDWAFEAGVLANSGQGPIALQIPYHPPEEYDLDATLRRVGGSDAIAVGLVTASGPACFVIDGYPAQGWITGLEMVDGKFSDTAPGSIKGRQFVTGTADAVLRFEVRKSSITVFVGGKKVFAWDGAMNRLGPRPEYKGPDPKALSLASWGGRNAFVELKLTPISGPGKRTRG